MKYDNQSVKKGNQTEVKMTTSFGTKVDYYSNVVNANDATLNITSAFCVQA